MSLVSMIRRQGTRASVYRGTKRTALNGSTAYGAPWVLVATLRLNLQQASAEHTEKAFASVEVLSAVAYAEPRAVAVDDRLLVTSGPFAGNRYWVADLLQQRQGTRHDHDQVALTSTTEAFP